MQAAYLLDQTVNTANAPDFYRKVAVPVFDGENIKEWIIPRGTVVDGEEALLRVSTGQAMPIDDECAKACGMTDGQLERNQRLYLAAEAGIRGKKDQELFMAGVIDGYGPGSTDSKPVYEPGENWDKWEAAKKAATKEKGSI